MAAYTKKTSIHLQEVDHKAHWAKLHSPGDDVPYSGIYRCDACGKEVTCNATDSFPPQNTHQHVPKSPITWRLIVRTDTEGDRFGL